LIHDPNNKPIGNAYPNGAGQEIFHETVSAETGGFPADNKVDEQHDNTVQKKWDDYWVHCAEQGIDMDNWDDIDSGGEDEGDEEDSDGRENDI
jgi:hypothetical protein